ncbi:MAG: hypothetical protein ACE5G8_10155 [Anaerolineae bacterium]
MAVNLRQLLNELPWPVLRFMARRRGLPVSSSASKERLVARLAVGLANLDGARQAVAGLGAPDKELLADLLAAGGSLPLDHARRLYGSLRPLRQVMRLWPEEGVSPLERLALLGLVFYHPPTQALVIPPAVAQALFPALDFKPLAPLPARPAVTKQPSDADWLEPALTARHDVAALLGLLTRHRPVLMQSDGCRPPSWPRGGIGAPNHRPIPAPAASGRRSGGVFCTFWRREPGWLRGRW